MMTYLIRCRDAASAARLLVQKASRRGLMDDTTAVVVTFGPFIESMLQRSQVRARAVMSTDGH